MTKRRGETQETHEPRGGAAGVELRSRRKRAQQPTPLHRHAVTEARADSNERFVQAFADALRDILRDELRRTASAA